MPYPSYSYLDHNSLEAALDMARKLHTAATSMDRLRHGEAVGGGRQRDKERVTQDWIGQTRDTFERLFDNERESASSARNRLADEADAWAHFWSMATNARNDRLYDESVRRYELALDDYRRKLADAPQVGLADRPPPPPIRSPSVTAPRSDMDYRQSIAN